LNSCIQGAFDDGDEDDDDDEDSVVKLSEEQVKVVQMAVNGESLFITGGAGTGKSLVIREIIRRSEPWAINPVFVGEWGGLGKGYVLYFSGRGGI
jgi:F0F1-type ATP synthase beta subunit